MGVIKYIASEFDTTVIKNTSGRTMYFDFIPPHGRTLADGDVVYLAGNLPTILSSGNYTVRRAKMVSYRDAIRSHLITADEKVYQVSSSSSSVVSEESSSSSSTTEDSSSSSSSTAAADSSSSSSATEDSSSSSSSSA